MFLPKKYIFIIFVLIISLYTPVYAKDYLASIFIQLNDGAPITSEQTIRLSLWSDGRIQSGDVDGAGAINTSATYYASYNTTITKTPDSLGRLKIIFGALSSFPQINPKNQFAMVEYKNSGDPDTNYTVYTGFYLQGTSFERVPLVSNGPDIFEGIYANWGTTSDEFILDTDDSGNDVLLTFGKALAEMLFWDTSEGRFEITDDLLVSDGFRVNTDFLTVNGTTGFVGIGTAAPDTDFHINGGISIKRTAVSDANYTVLSDDYLVAYVSLTAERTLTLNDSLCTEGRLFVIKDESGSASVANSIVIDPEGTTTIDGATTKEIELGHRSIQVYCNGTSWSTY